MHTSTTLIYGHQAVAAVRNGLLRRELRIEDETDLVVIELTPELIQRLYDLMRAELAGGGS